jgi:hypothetical protein
VGAIENAEYEFPRGRTTLCPAQMDKNSAEAIEIEYNTILKRFGT